MKQVRKKPKLKAYSYVRFSTPEQAGGDSLRRQTAQARHYAEKQGLELDETLAFHDLGISAHHGRNIEGGALGAFLDCVRDGRVSQGSYLLVESLDRISRQTAHRAVRVLGNIVDSGVTVVDLSDNGRVYSTETLERDQFAFVMMALRFMRAHEESATKGMRVAAAFDQKRRDAAAKTKVGKPFTRMLPGWIRWNDNRQRYELIPERAKIVREIFRKADSGDGQHAIAHWLNERGLEPWGVGKRKARYWHRSYVRKVLSNHATLGIFTPHKATKDLRGRRVRKPLDAIAGYWPPVVAKDLFERVNARLSTTAPRGRNAWIKPKSIFAGVLKCAHCGGSVVRVSKGEHVYLVCSQANARARREARKDDVVRRCKYQAVPYRDVERALTVNAQAIFEDAPRGSNTKNLERMIVVHDLRVTSLLESTEQLVDELVKDDSEAVRRRLKDRETELDDARDKLRTLKERLEVQSAEYVKRRLTALRDCLKQKKIDISATNRALKEATSKIIIDPEGGTLVIHWHHSDAVTEGPVFASRHSRVFTSTTSAAARKAERKPV